MDGGDNIQILPTDENIPTPDEVRIMNSYFKESMSTINKLQTCSKDTVLVILLFFLFSLPWIKDLIHKFIPLSRTNNYFSIGIRALLAGIVFFMIKNLFLIQN